MKETLPFRELIDVEKLFELHHRPVRCFKKCSGSRSRRRPVAQKRTPFHEPFRTQQRAKFEIEAMKLLAFHEAVSPKKRVVIANMETIVKAVICTRYGPPEVLQLSEVKKPAPRKHEVLVKIFATAVTPSDCVYRGAKISSWHPVGFMMRLLFGFTKPRNPLIGMVLAGEVESVGQNVKRFKTGDQVYGMMSLKFGTNAQYICVPENKCLIKKPTTISYEEAATVPWSGLIAQDFLKKGGSRSKRKVLVYGASGTIGIAAVQLAKSYGAAVTGVCETVDLEFVRALGVDVVIDYTSRDLLHSNECFDLIIDAVGKNHSPKLESQYRKMLTKQGRFMSVDSGMPNSKVEYLELLNEQIEAGRFMPIIDRIYPLEKIVEAHQYADDRFRRGNIAVTVAHE